MKPASNWTFKTFKDDISGQFSVWTAVLAFPVLLSVSMVVDMRVAEAHRSNIQRALDATTIAVASNNEISEDQKIQFANSVFDDNYQGELTVDLDVIVEPNTIEVNATADMPTSINGALGKGSIEIKQGSKAMMQQKNTICVLALAPTGRNRVSFLGNSDFDSPTCAVQANSSDSYALNSRSSHTPLAKSFCSVGGAYGRYEPPVKGECNRIADPYADLKSPRPGRCVPSTFYDIPGREKKKTNGQPVTPTSLTGVNLPAPTEFRLLKTYGTQLLNVPQSENVVSHNRVLRPGTYCGGLTVDGNNVYFLKGTYIIKDGPLTIKNGSLAYARDVTFVMHGPEAVVRIERGAKVKIKAPKDGNLAGIAFMQARDGTNFMQTAKMQYPNGLNLLRSGGELDVIGTLYFPTQAVDVSGDSRVGAQSPATSFIAYQVAFAGQTRATVGVDHVAAGLPPLLPQADDAARLIK